MVLPTPLERAPRPLCDFAGRDEFWLKREDVHELGVFKWRCTLPVVTKLGAVASEMPVMAASYEAGEPVDVPAGATIADRLAVRVAIPLAVERPSTAVDLMLRISENAISEASLRATTRMSSSRLLRRRPSRRFEIVPTSPSTGRSYWS